MVPLPLTRASSSSASEKSILNTRPLRCPMWLTASSVAAFMKNGNLYRKDNRHDTQPQTAADEVPPTLTSRECQQGPSETISISIIA